MKFYSLLFAILFFQSKFAFAQLVSDIIPYSVMELRYSSEHLNTILYGYFYDSDQVRKSCSLHIRNWNDHHGKVALMFEDIGQITSLNFSYRGDLGFVVEDAGACLSEDDHIEHTIRQNEFTVKCATGVFGKLISQQLNSTHTLRIFSYGDGNIKEFNFRNPKPRSPHAIAGHFVCKFEEP